MIHRAINICSTYSLLHEELNIILKIAKSNGYPSSFIEMLIGIKISKWYSKSDTCVDTDTDKKKKRLFIEVPFVENSTRMFTNDLRKFTAEIRPDSQLTIIEKPPISVQNFFDFKDKIPNNLKSDVIYNVKCKGCSSQYMGKTKREACRRLYQHGLPKDTYSSQSSQSLSNVNSS
ncbi:unnamed protein product [Didymodactylos carnosus]|uniref:Helix-turn-helix domain-containing protein n=1 Tax=Didymodactylos carnosus TaxID=1234261 RepID=A0A813VDU2_9BILA|nr:unnamed protein product [Didymodactylos carnosus]CAF3625976.1 unnamed protein product [Didymodactylos carnosus]